jgi:hypothetical protein
MKPLEKYVLPRLKKFWITNYRVLSLPSFNGNAALVKGLRRLPFTEESRVRIPYVVQSLSMLKGFFIAFTPAFAAVFTNKKLLHIYLN